MRAATYLLLSSDNLMNVDYTNRQSKVYSWARQVDMRCRSFDPDDVLFSGKRERGARMRKSFFFVSLRDYLSS